MPKQVVHLVDNDPVSRAAITQLLRSHGIHSEIYASGREFLADAKFDYGIVLLDSNIEDIDAPQILRELTARRCLLPVILVSDGGTVRAAVEVMRLGAVDVIEKPFDAAMLVATVERALALRVVDARQSALEEAALARLASLTPRQTLILQGMVAGLPNKVMARRLALSPRTIEMHRANVLARLGVANISEAIRIANRAGLSELAGGSLAARGRNPAEPEFDLPAGVQAKRAGPAGKPAAKRERPSSRSGRDLYEARRRDGPTERV